MGRVSYSQLIHGVTFEGDVESKYPTSLSQEVIDRIENYSRVSDSIRELFLFAYTDSSEEITVPESYLDTQIETAYSIMNRIEVLQEKKELTYNEIISVILSGIPDNIITEMLLFFSINLIVIYFSLSPIEKRLLEKHVYYDLIREVTS